jgi:hypothetical protein
MLFQESFQDMKMKSEACKSSRGRNIRGESAKKPVGIHTPRTFLSASSAYLRTNDEPSGVRRRFAERVAEDVARGSCSESQSMLMHALCIGRGRGNIQLLTILKTT